MVDKKEFNDLKKRALELDELVDLNVSKSGKVVMTFEVTHEQATRVFSVLSVNAIIDEMDRKYRDLGIERPTIDLPGELW